MSATSVQVLYKDYNNIWAMLSDMYWSQQSSTLISRHPISSVEEILAPYCPQCMTRYSEEEAIVVRGRCSTCKECPDCKCPLTPGYARCGYCQWEELADELEYHQTVSAMQESSFQVLLDSFTGGDVKPMELVGSQKRESSVWQMEELKKKLEQSAAHPSSSTANQHIVVTQAALKDISQAAAAAGVPRGTRPALGVPLRSKKVLRSKHDSRTGRMNILVQPKHLPLEGDSSLKLQKGKWWTKDSSAVQELPFISVVKLPERQALVDKTSPSYVELCITNPKMTEVRVIFSSLGLHVGCEPYLHWGRQGVSHVMHTGNALTASPRLRSLSQADSKVVEEKEEKVATPSLAITIGGFEDELLQDADEDEAAGSLPAAPAAGANGAAESDGAAVGMQGHTPQTNWVHRVVHNKAFVKIPVELSNYVSSSAPFALSLTCWVDPEGESTSLIELSFKVNFTYDIGGK